MRNSLFYKLKLDNLHKKIYNKYAVMFRIETKHVSNDGTIVLSIKKRRKDFLYEKSSRCPKSDCSNWPACLGTNFRNPCLLEGIKLCWMAFKYWGH